MTQSAALPQRTAACSALSDGSLSSLNDESMPAECGAVGSVAEGDGCYADVQCAAGCVLPDGALCGVCSSGQVGSACSSDGDCLIGVNSLVGGLVEESLDSFLNSGHSGHTSDEKDFVNLVLGES